MEKGFVIMFIDIYASLGNFMDVGICINLRVFIIGQRDSNQMFEEFWKFSYFLELVFNFDSNFKISLGGVFKELI